MPSATKTVSIRASAKRLFEIVTDYEHYPELFSYMKAVRVLSRSDDNRVQEVSFHLSMIKDFRYTLRIEHTPFTETNWTYLEGDFKDSTGGWKFEEDGETTRVTYAVSMDFGFAVPGFIARKLVEGSLPAMLNAVRKRAEG